MNQHLEFQRDPIRQPPDQQEDTRPRPSPVKHPPSLRNRNRKAEIVPEIIPKSFPTNESLQIILNKEVEENTIGRCMIPKIIDYVLETGQQLNITSNTRSASSRNFREEYKG